MTKRYTDEQATNDNVLIEYLLEQIDQLRKRCSDVVVLPICITLRDVAEMRLDTAKGPQRVGDVCTRDEMIAVLQALGEDPFGDPYLVLHYTIDDYRKERAVETAQ